MQRRDFLNLLAGSSALLLSESIWARSARVAGDKVLQDRLEKTGFVISTISAEPDLDPKNPKYDRLDTPTEVLFSNFSGSKIKVITLPFMPHLTTQNPVKKEEMLSVQRWGKNSAIYDVNNPKDFKKIIAPRRSLFFGHGVYTPDGKHVLMSLMNFVESHGEIAYYEVATQKLLQRIPTQGLTPHEIQLSKDGKSLFVANSGQERHDVAEELVWPSIVKIDLETLAVVEKHKVPLKGDFSHFVTIDEKNFVLLGVGNHGSLAILGPDRFIDLTKDKMLVGKIKGETLSGKILHDQNKVIVTIPGASLCAVVDVDKGCIAQTIEVDFPRGIVGYAQEPFHLVSSGNHGHHFTGISDKTLEKVALTTLPGAQSPAPSGWEARGPHFGEIIWPFT